MWRAASLWHLDPAPFQLESGRCWWQRHQVASHWSDKHSWSLKWTDFSGSQLKSFASQLETYFVLAQQALGMLVPFATTYCCETECSCLLHVKTKNRNRLTPRTDAIMERHHRQQSHGFCYATIMLTTHHAYDYSKFVISFFTLLNFV